MWCWLLEEPLGSPPPARSPRSCSLRAGRPRRATTGRSASCSARRRRRPPPGRERRRVRRERAAGIAWALALLVTFIVTFVLEPAGARRASRRGGFAWPARHAQPERAHARPRAAARRHARALALPSRRSWHRLPARVAPDCRFAKTRTLLYFLPLAGGRRSSSSSSSRSSERSPSSSSSATSPASTLFVGCGLAAPPRLPSRSCASAGRRASRGHLLSLPW